MLREELISNTTTKIFLLLEDGMSATDIFKKIRNRSNRPLCFSWTLKKLKKLEEINLIEMKKEGRRYKIKTTEKFNEIKNLTKEIDKITKEIDNEI